LMVEPDDEVYAITSVGGVIRTSAAEIKVSGRQTMGVRLVNLGDGQSLVAIARNAEATAAEVEIDAEAESETAAEAEAAGPAETSGDAPDRTEDSGTDTDSGE